MTNYKDFLLNELVGMAGLDFEQTAEVVHQVEEELDEPEEEAV